MFVYKTEYPKKTACVLALGCFDTVHLGHKKLIETALNCAREQNIPMGIYMFETRPANILNDLKKQDVYSPALRESVFESTGSNFVYYEVFSKEFMCMSPEEFVVYLKDKFDVQTIVVGFNYRFGKNASGDSALLIKLCEKHGIKAVSVPAVCDHFGVISSTRIRTCLENGNIQSVNALLGRMYALDGEIQTDRGVGRALGFPTANMKTNENLLLPKNGVYATIAYIDGKVYPSVTNVGIRPTFGLNTPGVETHLLDFNDDLYGKHIILYFHSFLREEITFSDVSSLKNQILSDINSVKSLFDK